MLKKIFDQGDEVTITVDGKTWMDREKPVVGKVVKVERLDCIQARRLASVWKNVSIKQDEPVYLVEYQGQTLTLFGEQLSLAA